MVVGPSRADSGRPLFVIFFFQKIFFQSRPESKKVGPTQKKVGPSFFFWFFLFCFVFFLVFFFGKDFTVGGADGTRLGPTFFFF